MLITAAESCGPMVRITWYDGSRTEYPATWLRDNCPSGFHPDTQERQFDLLSIQSHITARTLTTNGNALRIEWDTEPRHESRFDAGWLYGHRPGRRQHDPADLPSQSWPLGFAPPRFEAGALLGSDATLLDFLAATKQLGLAIVEGVAPDPEAGFAIGRRIGFLRPTNFGLSFRVESKPNPNALAYTAEALPLHTDLPNHELPPGYQFLHCISNEAEGGNSVFADGFAIAERIHAQDPEAFALLSRVPIPFRFQDADDDIRVHRPVIGLDERGRISEIRYSAHLAEPLDMEAETILQYYCALCLFMAETRATASQVALRLRGGEMAVFDNRRLLHGRSGFRPDTGYRLLSGFYVDRAEYDSRIRRLSRSTDS